MPTLDATTTHRCQLSSGAELQPDGSVRFRLWAPKAKNVGLEIDGVERVLSMNPLPDGWHELVTRDAHPGTLYKFVLPDGLHVPDPASRFQPFDVHGFSEVIDPTAYRWSDNGWKGCPWSQAVLYELHVGTFTPEGTFRAAIGKLDHLQSLGVTAIELMPIGDFPGWRNWGYDGVALYAPEATYGRPDDLKTLVEAAHARNIMVLLDVVYNHFGPDGNYIPTYAPQFYTEHHHTPWGAAINYDAEDSAHVRQFIIENALYWITEFHLDGLRFDAVHAIKDDSQRHLLAELAERVRSSVTDRPVHLVLENEGNQSHWLVRNSHGQPPLYTAQWNDDIHHVLHVAGTGEDRGYYEDFAGDTTKLARALAEGFAFQGEFMHTSGHDRGEPTRGLPPSAFVSFLQNHDQVGNRAFGERMHQLVSKEVARALAAVYLLLPQVPMLFMGEEWGCTQPFPFFCDFHDELAEAIRKGRRNEFAKFPEFSDPAQRQRIPDPLAESTFASARLIWSDLADPTHADWLNWYTRVLAVRRERLPMLSAIAGPGRYQIIGAGAVSVEWTVPSGGVLRLDANLSASSVSGFPPASETTFWQEGPAPQNDNFAPWSVRWQS